jgi:hypothetical protein
MDCAQRDQCLRLLVQCGILGDLDVSLLRSSRSAVRPFASVLNSENIWPGTTEAASRSLDDT